MASKKVTMRLQTPPDENGDRSDIHLITTADEVIVDPDSADSSTLTEKLGQLGTIHIQSTQPEFACIWAKPVE